MVEKVEACIAERLYRMFGMETMPNLFFLIASKYLNNSLIEHLGVFPRNHPDTGSMIIETFQKSVKQRAILTAIPIILSRE